LFLRSLDSIEPKRLPGTEDAYLPFWSPDNRYIGFFANNKLKKIDANGSSIQTICDSGGSSGGTWNSDGVILFSSQGQPLRRVAAAGGQPTVALTLEPKAIQHDYPLFLPDGRHFLYCSWDGNPASTEFYVGTLDGTRRQLFTVNSNVGYAASGYLLFARDSTLMAQAFDPAKLALSGDPFPVLEHVAFDAGSSFTYFSVAANGTIVFRKSTDNGRQLIWIDRSGKQIAAVGPPGAYNDIMLSPDGDRAAMQKIDGTNSDIWIMDLVRGVPQRFTFAETSEDNPSWSPDGKFLIYTSTNAGNHTTFLRKNASGGGDEEKIYESDAATDDGTDWSGDGKNLLCEQGT
ncbi:MAG TPA: hypothetical protein VNT76_00500, partial [Candidatus Binatus sp.]|nr:hypothetical protein [Candidatus Binatus sp.]